MPAAIANLQPSMSVEEVDAFLDSQDMSEMADKPIRIRSSIPDQPLPAHFPPQDRTTTLRHLLAHHLDLRCSPRKSFFEWLRRLSQDEREQERLDEFISDPVSHTSVKCADGRMKYIPTLLDHAAPSSRLWQISGKSEYRYLTSSKSYLL